MNPEILEAVLRIANGGVCDWEDDSYDWWDYLCDNDPILLMNDARYMAKVLSELIPEYRELKGC